MSLFDTAARFIAERGESMTLAREGEGTTITLKGKRIIGALVDMGNTAAQQSFRVKIGTAELAASAWATKVPARTDRITIDSRVRSILDVRPIGDGGTVALYDLEVAG